VGGVGCFVLVCGCLGGVGGGWCGVGWGVVFVFGGFGEGGCFGFLGWDKKMNLFAQIGRKRAETFRGKEKGFYSGGIAY